MDDRLAQIEDIIASFNFEKVHIAMTALDWQWISEDSKTHEVPSIGRLKEMARHLLYEAINKKFTASGGFHARYIPKVDEYEEYFTLQFVLASADTHRDD